MGYQHLAVERRDGVGWLWLDRPDKLNALSPDMWGDLPLAVADLTADQDVRALVVAGRGRSFTVGVDLAMLAGLRPGGSSPAEANTRLYQTIRRLQAAVSTLSECPLPVIAAVQGHCLGAGLDIITACDIRLATADAVFSVRETKMALVADLGTLQRLPQLIGAGHAAELVYTGTDVAAPRAERIGLVNRVYPDTEALLEAAQDLGAEIASNSPLAVQGSKRILASRADLSTEQALDQVALWNAAFLDSNDLAEALAAFAERRRPRFTGT